MSSYARGILITVMAVLLACCYGGVTFLFVASLALTSAANALILPGRQTS